MQGNLCISSIKKLESVPPSAHSWLYRCTNSFHVYKDILFIKIFLKASFLKCFAKVSWIAAVFSGPWTAANGVMRVSLIKFLDPPPDLDLSQNVIASSLLPKPHLYTKFYSNPLCCCCVTFLTNRETNADENITSLVEVIRFGMQYIFLYTMNINTNDRHTSIALNG